MFLERVPRAEKLLHDRTAHPEMVIKTVQMRIPILISRSGSPPGAWTLAQGRATLIGRARGKRFVALAGEHRIVFDADTAKAFDEPGHLARKSSRDDRDNAAAGVILAAGSPAHGRRDNACAHWAAGPCLRESSSARDHRCTHWRLMPNGEPRGLRRSDCRSSLSNSRFRRPTGECLRGLIGVAASTAPGNGSRALRRTPVLSA